MLPLPYTNIGSSFAEHHEAVNAAMAELSLEGSKKFVVDCQSNGETRVSLFDRPSAQLVVKAIGDAFVVDMP